MTTQEKIAVMQGYLDGKQIQVINTHGEWEDWPADMEPQWDWIGDEYRIKPEPKEPTYRPYKDFAEFRAEWEKHSGWAIDKSTCSCRLVNTFNLDCANALLTNYTWADDETPCGIKEE